MDEAKKKFIKEGMGSYKAVRAMTNAFEAEIKQSLSGVLKKVQKWGRFKPAKDEKIRSTTYGKEYPYLNSQLVGTLDEKPAMIEIGIQWYDTDGDYPFYVAKFYNNNDYDERINAMFSNNALYAPCPTGLKYYPDPDKFNLEKDFESLVANLVKVVS